MTTTKSPRFTVITVVYNDCCNIRTTIDSVLSQTYKSYDYIIVDGGSTDGTKEIILQHAHSLKSFISEKDSGIYEAMNKGILLCDPSSFVIFINCGDEFHSKDTLASVADRVTGYSAYTGRTEVHYKNISWVAASTKHNLSHQSTFLPGSWLTQNPFSLKYKICADRESLQNAGKSLPVVVLDMTIARFALGGISNYNPSLAKSLAHAAELIDIQSASRSVAFKIRSKYILRCVAAKVLTKDFYFTVMAKIWKK